VDYFLEILTTITGERDRLEIFCEGGLRVAGVGDFTGEVIATVGITSWERQVLLRGGKARWS